MVLDSEVILARELGRNSHEERAFFTDSGKGLLPGFELGHAVRTPAASEKKDDERADAEEVRGMDQACVGGGFAGEGGCGGVREIEDRGGGANGEDAVFDARKEKFLDGFISNGETAGLDKGAGLGRDVVEFGLEVGGVRHLALSVDGSQHGEARITR